MYFVIRLLLNAAALLLIADAVPGLHVGSYGAAILSALVLGIVNAILRPVLILLTLPLVVLTLGLFTLVINAFAFYLVGKLGLGLSVHGFGAAFIGALLMTIVSFALSQFVKPAVAAT
ncbi:MAG: phage holin family protein [Vulcanimicrobiaceae bacterium]